MRRSEGLRDDTITNQSECSTEVRERRMEMDGSEPASGNRMEQLAKQAAGIGPLLAALPADGLRNDSQSLDAIEQVALRVLEEVSAVRAARKRPVGETSGMWRAMQPVQR